MRRPLPVMLLAMFSSALAFGAATEPPPPKAAPLVEVKLPATAVCEDEPLPDRAIVRLGRMRDWRGIEGNLLALPDGKYLLAAFGDKAVRIWDVETGEVIAMSKSSPVLEELEKNAAALAVSSDGKRFAVGTGKLIRIMEVKDPKTSGSVLPRIHESEVIGLSFSPDGKFLASIGQDRRIAIWNVAEMKLERDLANAFVNGNTRVAVAGPNGGTFAPENARAIAFTADGKALVTCTYSGIVQLWDNHLKELKKLEKINSADSVFVLPDGKTVACMSWNDGVVFWDMGSGKVVRRLPKYKGFAAISADGRWLATAPHSFPASAKIAVYDLKEDREAFTLPGHLGGTWRFTFAPDARTLHTYGNDHVLRHWDLTTQKEINPPTGHSAAIRGAAFLEGGKAVVTCSQDGTVRLWDAATGKEIRRLAGKREYFMALAVSADRKTLAVSSLPTPSNSDYWSDPAKSNATLHFWNVASMTESDGRSLAGAVARRLQFSADGAELMILNADRIQLHDVKTGRDRQPVNQATHGLHAAALSPDGKTLASATDQPALRQVGRVGFWNLSNGQEIAGRSFMFGSYRDLAYSPDGKFLAVAGGGGHARENNSLALWLASTDKIHLPFKSKRFDHYRLAYAPDGRLVAAADPDGISVFETATGEERWRFEGGHTQRITCLAFSDDAGRLVSAGDDGLAYVWDLRSTGKPAPKLDRQEIERYWNLLGDVRAPDAAKAMLTLAARPAESIPLLKERLSVLTAEEQKRIEAMIATLDSDQFKVRDRAARDLESLGELAVPQLGQAANDTARSAEVRDRAATLLKRIGTSDDPLTSAAARRSLRAIEALEHARTPEATALLKDLATRARSRLLQEEAVAAVNRLGKLSVP